VVPKPRQTQAEIAACKRLLRDLGGRSHLGRDDGRKVGQSWNQKWNRLGLLIDTGIAHAYTPFNLQGHRDCSIIVSKPLSET
jgi:hypothetical protein